MLSPASKSLGKQFIIRFQLFSILDFPLLEIPGSGADLYKSYLGFDKQCKPCATEEAREFVSKISTSEASTSNVSSRLLEIVVAVYRGLYDIPRTEILSELLLVY